MAHKLGIFKKILAILMTAFLIAVFPMSVNATGSSSDDSDIENEQDDDDSDDDSESSSDDEDSDDEDDSDDSDDSDDEDDEDSDDEDSDDESDENSDEEDAEADEDEVGEESDVLEEDHPSGILMIDADPDNARTAEGTSLGNGIVRITKIKRPKNVVSMVVPILSDINYNFVLDPEGLLQLNPENEVVGGESTVYFRSNESDSTYTVFADVATAINKSTVPVSLEVELDIRGAAANGIDITDLRGVHSAETPSLCMAILPTEIDTVEGNDSPGDLRILKNEMAQSDSNGHAYKEIIIPGSVDNFELVTLTTSERDVYVQEYRALDDADWSVAGFSLYGACTRNADWSEVVENLQNGGSLSISITYRMTPIFDGEDD